MGEKLLSTSFPTKIKSLQGVKIDKVACGPRNTLFLSGDNQLYKTNVANCLPIRIFERELAQERIVDIAAGSSHFMVLNDEGEVLTWGDNDAGQLGHGEGVKQNTPKQIATLKGVFINRISCGAAHSMAVSKTGNAFVWGSNIRGQLGYDPKVCKYLSIPTKISLMLKDTIDEEIKEEQVPYESQDVEMENEEEEKIQEDQPLIKIDEPKAEEVKAKDQLDEVKHGVCGTWSSIFVTETRKTRLHVWGGEEEIVNSSIILYNNLQEGNTIEYIKSRGDILYYINKLGELHEYSIKNKKEKFIEKLPRFLDLSLGSNFMGIVHHDNTLHMKGANKEGQLGTGDKNNRNESYEQITSMEPTRVKGIN